MLVDVLGRVLNAAGRSRRVVGYVCGVAAGSAGATDLSFAELSLQRGLNYIIGAPHAQFGAGQGFVDLNGDGHLDVVVLGALNGLVGVYQNTGTGSFINRSFATGIAPMTGAAGFSACDYDADGDLDLFVSGWFVSNRLLRNNGNFGFTDVTAQAGLTLAGPSNATTWSDFDGDGWVDLYVTTRTGTNANMTPNKLYRNRGDGTFVDVAAAVGVDAGIDPSLLAAFFDFDGDGDDDLYVGTDKGSGGLWKNRLFRNDGGTFMEITDQANAAAYIDCMGIAIGDLDFNGYFDLYMTNVNPGNKLLMNTGAGAFVDETAPSGMAAFTYTWATVFADLNNDTHLETYVCADEAPNILYEGSASWPLADVAAAAGVATPGDSYSVAVGDADGDGDLDLLVGDENARVKLYINNTVTANHAVRMRVAGQGANTHAVGARVDVLAGGVWQARQVYAGSNYKAMNEFVVHVGLGAAASADTVVVRWPGTGDTRTLSGMPAGERWTIHPPEKLGDGNQDGRVDLADMFVAMSRVTGPGVPIDPGDEILDMDGDFDIDAADVAALAARATRPSLPTIRRP